MKILGIGNAIVDVICKVDYNFINQNNLTKSTMKLFFDENEFKKLLTNVKIEKTVSGGSVANSIVGISQLGDKAGFIGKVSDDEFGGETFDANLKVAKSALDAFGTDPFKQLLSESGLGNHPEVIRFMYRAGKAISEDSYVGNSQGANAKSNGIPKDFDGIANALYSNQQNK